MKQPVLLISSPVTKEDLSAIKDVASQYRVILLQDFNESIDQIEAMYGWDKEVGKAILDSPTSQLKWLQVDSAGVDHLDLEKLKAKGIILTNARGVHGNQMSESILGMIFAHTRKIKQSILYQEESRWEKNVESEDLAGKKVLIAGTGHIGERLAEILNVFHANVVGVNRSGRNVPNFKEIIKQDAISESLTDVDIIINLLPDTAETHHFFSKDLFELMKDNVIFINAGRGGTVNTEDLITYCENGKIGFAGLDVFEVEPLPSTSPLWKLENVLITSHISGATDQYFIRLMPIFLANLKAYVTNQSVVENRIEL